jgi:putative DNA primase/helicase
MVNGTRFHPSDDDAHPNDVRVEVPGPGVTLIGAHTIRPEAVDWLWPGWLARGKVHVLAGAPGTGKTTAALALAATVTTGGRWPDGTRAAPGEVLIWSGEDDPKDTLVPRLIAAGADLRRVRFVASTTDDRGPRAFDPASDMDALSEAIADRPPTLLIVDPVVSAVAGDSHKNAEVRRALQPLVDLAMVRRCAVLGVSHFTKGTAGRDPTDRVTGSLAFGALARVVLVAAKLPADQGGGRLLARAKSNLGPDGGGFGYDLEVCDLDGHPGLSATRVLWGEALTGTARELLGQAEADSDPEERTAVSEAVDWLLEHLTAGPSRAGDVLREARNAGISEKSVRTARERLGVKPTRAGFAGGWVWALPVAEDAPKMPQAAQTQNEGTLGTLGTFEGTLEEPPAKMPTPPKVTIHAERQGTFGTEPSAAYVSSLETAQDALKSCSAPSGHLGESETPAEEF